MKNPILSESGYKFYLMALGLITVAHCLILHFYFQFSWEISISDSLSHNILFGIMAPGYWYIVNFASNTKDELSLIGMHSGAAALTILLWATVSSYPLRIIFGDQEHYLNFLNRAYIWRVIIGLLYYSIVVLIFNLLKYYQDMRERIKREMELQHLLKDAELQMLKSQINPHFIFNSLNSISALTLSSPDQAQQMVIKLSNFLRFSLGKDNSETNTLQEEIQNAELYIDIEKIRFGSKLNFSKTAEETCLQAHVPNLILQPLVENAIKHGLYQSLTDTTIALQCQKVEKMIYITLSNNFDAEYIPPKSTGIGIENVRKRLELVYERTDLMVIKKTKDTFEIALKIPVEY